MCEFMSSLANQYCDFITELAQHRKSEACLMNRGVADTSSFVSVSYRDEMMTIDSMGGETLVETLPRTLDAVIKTGLMKFDVLAFTAEVYMKPAEGMTEEEANRYKRGDLEKEYQTNPLTDVIEGLFTVVTTWEGDTAYRFVKVNYDDKGQPVYGDTGSEVATPQRNLSGFVTRILNDYREYCRRELASDEGEEYLKAFDELVKEQGSLAKAVEYITTLDIDKN